MKTGALVNIQSTPIPCFSSRVPAGFPSPADDYLDSPIDLNQHIVKHPAATFYVRACGDSMVGAGIFNDDLLVIDRSLQASGGQIVLAIVDGDFTVKRLSYRNGRPILCPENDRYRPIIIQEQMDFEIWGVVTHVVHQC